MGKCLVTKLNGTVSNSSLLRLGELVLEVNTNSASKEILQLAGKTSEYSCEQAYVLETENVAANVRRNVKDWAPIKSIGAGVYRFHIFNKYNLSAILSKSESEKCDGYTFLNTMTELYLNNIESFDISALKRSEKLKKIQAKGNIYGDISQLKNLTSLTGLSLTGSDLYGDISQLKNLTSLTGLSLNGVANMNISSSTIRELPFRSITIDWKAMIGKDFGDLAVMHPNLCYIDCGSAVHYTWTSRSSSSKIIALSSSATIDNIDKMLQDQAQCQVGFTSSDSTFYKIIKATGTRTSASDAAVQTLQSKGYTVSITPA